MTTSTTTTVRKSYGNRKLYSFPEDYLFRNSRQKSNLNNAPKKSEDVAKIIKYIDDNIVGKNNAFFGPFGRRKVVFCDYISSGRSLQFIEEYILREVLPSYGNTNSTSNITSLQSTLFRQEARDIIRNAVNANEEDAVIFAGHGCLGAIQKLISALDFREPPVVFVFPSEHHDNIQLWQEIGAKIIRVCETKNGFLDLNDLEEQLKLHQNTGRQMIGCFTIASNVTGLIADDIASTLLLHQYGAYAFWNYNIAAPYVAIDMNPFVPGMEENGVYKDAIYFSGHKFVGGVQTPGILVAKKSLFRHTNCDVEGFFASQEAKKSFELQEEGSDAAVVESVRAGLVMQLKETITPAFILQRLEKITKQMLQHIRTIPEIILLGNNSPSLKRIPVFSFIVKHPRGTFLHHNFVSAILNDVFGIQARSGCPCSGSYAQDLLGIDQILADQYESIILEDRRLSSLNLCVDNSTLELLRPGFTRISLPYFINDAELAFVMEAVKMVATEGWKLLPQYVVDLNTGEWRHHTNAVFKDRKWLTSVRYVDGKMTVNERRISGPGLFPQNYSECLQTARNLFNRARKTANRCPYNDQGITFDARCEKLRWFMLQQEAQNMLTSNSQNVKHTVPFDPVAYAGSKRTQTEEKPSGAAHLSGASSPRHYSLPAIDDHRIIGNSSPLPPYYLQQQQDVNVYYSTQYSQPAALNFAVGEAVSAANLNSNLFRERCLSLGAPNVSPPILSPQTRVSLGINNSFRQRNYSYSSEQVHSLDSDVNTSPTQSLNMLSAGSFDCISQMGRASPAPDLQTYVTEMTKELATNIKSEIREVTRKVEDVLESSTDAANEKHCSGSSDDGRSDSISANEVAEYIEKVSIEMANEVKSEIRDVVSAVDVFIAPEAETYTPGSSSETVIQLIKEEKAANRNRIAPTSLSSQDSGINLSFQEQECTFHDYVKRRCSSESITNQNPEADAVKFATLQRQKRKEISEDDKELARELSGWSPPPKVVFQATVEAIEEYKMIRNGDKVLVCLSGGKDSISLLHTLLEFQQKGQSKGVVFSLAAVTVNTEACSCTPSLLGAHLGRLGVRYFVEGCARDAECESANRENLKDSLVNFSTKKIRHCLYRAATNDGYNVLAVAQHLDDISESFIMSLFHTGSLQTMKAHYYIRKHNLRVIRPFVYVREKSIRQFSRQINVPVLASSTGPELTKERQRAKQLLAQQEILFPKLFSSLRASVHPLLGFHEANSVPLLQRMKNAEQDAETEEEPPLVPD